MTQHDFNIANNTFPAFRADLNNALSAIQSNNSGSSSPSTTTSYMQWVDTSNNILKIRNSADNDWISILKTDGVQQYASGGTASLPAFSKADDIDTGILFPAADTLAISTGGTEQLRIDSSGDLGVGTSGYSINDRVSVLCSGDARSLGVYRNFSGNSAAGVIISLGRRDGSGGVFDTAQIVSTGSNNTATNGDISFHTLTSGSLTQKMKIDSAGKVFMPSLASSGSGTNVIINPSTGELYEETSSLQFKKQVQDIKFDTSKLYDIRPRTFIRLESDVEEFGLIAEEVTNLIPDVVSFKNNKPYSINYAKLVVPIIAEMKKLKAEILEMKKNN